jgi:integrase
LGVDVMASLSKEAGRGSWKLTWYGFDKRKKAIRLGSMPKKSAEQFRVKFEELLGVRRGGGSLPAGLSEWLDGLGDELHERIVGAGLAEPRERMTLGGLCDAFIASRSGVAPATKIRDRQIADRLLASFGRDRNLESITVRDAEEWRRLLASEGNLRDSERAELGENTVRRRTGVARQIFKTAVRWKLIKSNPFDGLATSVRENLERREFVSWADTLRVIKQAPSTQWAALIAFCRLIGPRVPSELSGLTWADVDFASKRVVIRSPKTAHHGGEHALRSVPLFPEVVPYLQALSDSVGPGIDVPMSAPVFPMVVDASVNLRTHLKRLIVRAGLTPWQKLFVNLRSSRETELLASYPAADVCRWMGHSPAMAARFYAQARPEIAERASNENTVGAGDNAGYIVGDEGDKMGSLGGRQEASTIPNELSEVLEALGLMMVPGGVVLSADGPPLWALRDSNPRPSRCKRDALTN